MKKILPNPRRLCDGMKGQNYWLNGCLEYVMECLGEDTKAYDYWFFSNITGDSLMHVHSKDPRVTAWCPSRNVFDAAFARRAFDACGYECEFAEHITDANRAEFLPRIKASIDRGVPVICRDGKEYWDALIFGYDGDALHYLIPDSDELRVLPASFESLVFTGAKKEKPAPGEVLRRAVMDIPMFLTRPATARYSFGKQALVDWAESFQNGTYDNIPAEDIGNEFGKAWNAHGTHLCMLGTNACVKELLARAKALNPGMGPLVDELLPLYDNIHNRHFAALAYVDGGLNGGFDIRPETIKDKARMRPVSDKIMECAALCNNILACF